MGFKFAHFIKLCLIVTISMILLASVGTAPEQPFFFLAVSAVSIPLIRFIWKSALRDNALKKQKIKRNRKSSPIREFPPNLKRAA